MKDKRKIRVVSWVLTIVMLITSLGLDTLPVMAAPAAVEEEETTAPATPAEDAMTEETVAPAADAEAEETTEPETGKFTYKADFTASYTTADMTFTLETIGGEVPTGNNNVDIYIKASTDSSFQQIGWYKGLDADNRVTIENLKYQYQALTPGVTYNVQIQLRHDNNIIGQETVSFTTKPVTVSYEEKLITWFSAEYSLTVAEKDALVSEGITQLKVYPYIQEKGGTPVKANVGGDGIDLLKDDLAIRDLKEDTEYTVYFAGLRDNAEPCLAKFNFKTIKDTRKLTLTTSDIEYCYASFSIAVSGGREDVDTKSYLFLRKEGETEWQSQKQNDKKETFSKEFRMNGLDPVTKYEYVLAIGDDWNVNDPDAITKAGHKITGSFTTPEDPRELTAVASAGYQTALIRAGYTNNNLSGVQSVIHAFVREKGTDDWTEVKNASYDTGNSFDLIFKDLKQDTEYEYRVILNSKWDNTTADDTVRPLQYQTGSFKTSLCRYTLELTPDTDRSVYNREYLQVALTGSKADRKVKLSMLFSNTDRKELYVYRDEAYTDTFSLKGLSSDTVYNLTEYAFYVEEFGETVCIKDVTCKEGEYSFRTPVAVAPNYVKFEQEALYLNVAQAEEENVGNITLKPVVNEGASDEMLWESTNPDVVKVDENGKVTAVSVGEAEIIATSKYNKEVSARVKVFTDSYQALYEESGTHVSDDTISGLKGTQSEAVIIGETVAGETVKVPVTGYLAERDSVVSYDTATHKITFGNAGTSKLYLLAGNYKVRIHVESYVRTAAFYVDSLSNDSYPAVEKEENTYELAEKQDYQINLKAIDGSVITNYRDFTVTIEKDSKGSVTVDQESFVLSAGGATDSSVKITISPKEGTAYDHENTADAVFYVTVKALPEENKPDRYVYTNIDKVLSDVKLKDGWKWENEKLALYALRKTQTYDFAAYYAGEDKYPQTQKIRIALAEVKDFTAEDISKTNYTVTADGEDKVLVKLGFSYVGQVQEADLSTYLKTDGEGCIIEQKEKDGNEAVYEIKATKAGIYTIEAGVWSEEYGKAVIQKTITVNATEKSCVRSIKVQNTSKEPAAFLKDDELLLDAGKDIKSTISLKAVTYDYRENETAAPKLIWTSSDKSVAQVTVAGKNDTQNAKLLIKGEGNAVITVTSTDTAAVSYSFVVEVKNLAPRVDGNKVSINTALDYNSTEGRDIAYRFCGFTEIVEAYDNKVTDWHFYRKTKKTFEQEKEAGLFVSEFLFYEQNGVGNKRDILISPTDPDMKNGKYELWLVVNTEAGEEEYAYPVTVTVMKKTVKVSAASDNINTFYLLKENDDIAYTFNGDYLYNPTVNWVDDSEKAIGFGIGKYIYYNETKKKWCSHVDTSALQMDGRLPAAGTATGTLEFTFKGYRDTVKITRFKIKNCYKLPNITTVNTATTINTDCGIDSATFYLYQKDAKKRIAFHNGESKYYYSTYKSNIEEVEVYPTSDYSDYMEYVYTGENKKENLVITLRSDYWREKVEVKHTINNVAPTLILEKNNMMFNWNLPGTDTTVFKVKNAQNGAILKDVIITGKNADAQKLIDENVFTFTLRDNKYLDVKLNSVKSLNKKFLKDGSYAFQVTPVFVNRTTGKEVTGKACALTVKTTPKAPEVNLSASGSIDIAKYPMLNSWEFYKNAIKLKYTFKNVNSNYEEIGREVIGDYAGYFAIWWSDAGQGFYLVPRPGMEGRLKAGFVYNVQIKFTLRMKDGTTTEVISKKPYKLKLKQSSVAVKVNTKPQTLYLSNEKVVRVYELALSNGYYHIDTITGSLDVNKDGKADIVIENVQKKSGDTAADVTVRIADRDAISATAKGKSYSVPVEIMVTGADGISKNIKTQIKITVKK